VTAQNLLEISESEADGGMIGRDPRRINLSEFSGAGIAGRPLLAVIRAKCLDCCCGQATEVRKCVATKCALWPYRMAANPFRKLDLSDEERQRRVARMRRAP